MRKLLTFFSMLSMLGCGVTEPQSRKMVSFNEQWLFKKTEDSLASTANYKDSDWRSLSVPHDYAIEGPFKPDYDLRTGGLPIFEQAWYRKHFFIDKIDKDNIVTLEFDGIMSNSTIFINDEKVYHRPYGYIGFQIDITPYIIFGGNNVIAVKVNPEDLSARWYPGAGIYRNVRLEIKHPVHVKHWGTYITTPVITKEKADVSIETKLTNAQKLRGAYQVQSVIYTSDSLEVASAISDELEFKDKETSVTQKFKINNPRLWDFNSPHLYKVVTIVLKNGIPIDNYNSTFGIRTTEFTREGFFLNGRKEKIKGVCLHNDLGPLGSAVNYRATERQLEIMKNMGINAIRTSHNPTSPEQLGLCDKMGILVQSEAFDCWKLGKTEKDYNKHWDEWYEKDLRDMIKRDRNHPSVFMWSIGNEVREQKHQDGYKIAKELVEICHDEDPTRPTTSAFNQLRRSIENGLAKEVDLVGANYKPTMYASTMKNHEDWIVYGSETASTVSSRGVYHLPLEDYDKHESLQVNSYDFNSPSWAYPPDVEFYFQDLHPNILGEFVWTGFDYLGEPTPYGGKDNFTHGYWHTDWPSRSSYFGIVDLSGFPKDRFYLYQSQWTSDPMVHILPHWNWEGSDIKDIPVYCYTNAEEAELFINGKSQGRKIKGVDKTKIPVDFYSWGDRPKYFDSPYRLSWSVKYEPGEIEVVAYNRGKEVNRKKIVTAKAPHKINLEADKSSIKADGQDLSFITVKIEDENSNFCPLANNKIDFEVKGPATIVAVGNGNAASTEPFQANYRKAFNGLCLLVLKSKKGETGSVTVIASSKELQSKTITISTK